MYTCYQVSESKEKNVITVEDVYMADRYMADHIYIWRYMSRSPVLGISKLEAVT